MGRCTGPRERLSRRAGIDLELKGERRMAGKGAVEPVRHASARRRQRSALQRHEIQAPIEEQMVVEFYSRV